MLSPLYVNIGNTRGKGPAFHRSRAKGLPASSSSMAADEGFRDKRRPMESCRSNFLLVCVMGNEVVMVIFGRFSSVIV